MSTAERTLTTPAELDENRFGLATIFSSPVRRLSTRKELFSQAILSDRRKRNRLRRDHDRGRGDDDRDRRSTRGRRHGDDGRVRRSIRGRRHGDDDRVRRSIRGRRRGRDHNRNLRPTSC